MSNITENYEQIARKLYGGVQGGNIKSWLNSGGKLGLRRCVNEQNKEKKTSNWGAFTDPETFGLTFHQGSTLIYAYCQAATNLVDQDCRVMIFLNQGDLGSYTFWSSASSSLALS